MNSVLQLILNFVKTFANKTTSFCLFFWTLLSNHMQLHSIFQFCLMSYFSSDENWWDQAPFSFYFHSPLCIGLVNLMLVAAFNACRAHCSHFTLSVKLCSRQCFSFFICGVLLALFNFGWTRNSLWIWIHLGIVHEKIKYLMKIH